MVPDHPLGGHTTPARLDLAATGYPQGRRRENDMPRGKGIYRDEPRDERESDTDAEDRTAPDDTSSEHAQEPPD